MKFTNLAQIKNEFLSQKISVPPRRYNFFNQQHNTANKSFMDIILNVIY